ncbi:hypothetical protein [Methanosarcina horonobensis]|uniref:hypothetical protein n=1 Tax=Methanosarcina horonobensis TaxID=418008 RepID=UPI000B122AAA|nr:hypothetical protein [Methanosarcina horonobensis]
MLSIVMPRVMGFERRNRIQVFTQIEKELCDCVEMNLLDLNDVLNVALEKYLQGSYSPNTKSIIVIPRIKSRKFNRVAARPYIEQELLNEVSKRLLDLKKHSKSVT